MTQRYLNSPSSKDSKEMGKGRPLSVAAFSSKSGDRISHQSYKSKYSSKTNNVKLPGLSRL